jgi:UDP-2,3-diacylglucosamine hydrolase
MPWSQTIQSTVVICSDLHIKGPEDPRYGLFLEMLQCLDLKNVECLILNGDIFDFCFGNHPYFRKKFQNIGEQLESLARGGLKIIFVQGNHEFDLKALGWQGISFITAPYEIYQVSSGETILITHGDLLCSPWHYRLYAQVVRSWLFSFVASFLPGKKLDDFALYLSHLSREKGAYKKLDHKKVLTSALHLVESKKVSYGVIGHYHYPYGYKKKVFGLNSWDKPNLLTFKNGKFLRIWIG